MPAPTQKNRAVSIGTPLGDDVLLLKSAMGTEQLGRLFQFDLQLLSSEWAIDFNAIVGKNVTLRLERSSGGGTRYFNGFISRFTQMAPEGELAAYTATMVPWTWFLTRISDCRIFQQMTVPEIIKQIFSDYGFSDVRDALSGSYRTWEYCVQYRETCFNFISRLMEQEGIYYFFEHENGKHTLVLADAVSSHQPCEGYEKLTYRPQSTGIVSGEYVTDWTNEQQVLSGNFAHRDFNFEQPKTILESSSTIQRQHAQAAFEVYDYPGEFTEASDGDTYAKLRIEELQTPQQIIRGATEARGLVAGGTFELDGFPRADQNAEYLVKGIQHQIVADAFGSNVGASAPLYSCDFEVIPKTNSFRSARATPKPQIAGPQTAIVTGPSNEEIYTDEHGRVKVQFHWDRDGQFDENSSCWVRVSQSWAGKNWGAFYLPRIGQEVIVEFLEGDPDRPLVTGRVYNGVSKPPYELPAEKTKSTLKSNSSKGGKGFNELRFEDKKDEEQIFLHAEKDLDTRVLNDHREAILGNYDLRIGEGEKGEGEVGNRTTWIELNDQTLILGDRIEKVEGDHNETTAGDNFQAVDGAHHHGVGGDMMEDIGGDSHLNVGGNWNAEAGSSISRKAGQDVQEKAGGDYAMEAGSNIHLKGGMNVVIEAGSTLTLKTSSAFITISSSGVDISGPMVKINSGGSPGSGSGSSPTAPTAPEAPEEPVEAIEADDDQAGGSASYAAQTTNRAATTLDETTVAAMDAQADALEAAAREGSAFCEECAKARKDGDSKS